MTTSPLAIAMSEDEVIAQRTIIKFLSNEHVNITDILQWLREHFGNEALSWVNVFKWYKLFCFGRKEV